MRPRHASTKFLAFVVVVVSAVLATQSVNAQTYSVLYSFKGGADGQVPMGSLIRDAAGNLYGTTFTGGVPDRGTVFKLDSTGNETVLYTFSGADGGNPFAGMIRDAAGNLYGTTGNGGVFTCYGIPGGCGTVFKLDPTGTLTVLHSFDGSDGSGPFAGLVYDNEGNLYGTTAQGGDLTCDGGNTCGVVFKLDKKGVLTVLHTFTGGADGNNPSATLIRDAGGNLYGTYARLRNGVQARPDWHAYGAAHLHRWVGRGRSQCRFDPRSDGQPIRYYWERGR